MRDLLDRTVSRRLSGYEDAVEGRLGPRTGLEAVEREIAAEIAASLGRATRKLERAVAEVTALGLALDAHQAARPTPGEASTFAQQTHEATTRTSSTPVAEQPWHALRHEGRLAFEQARARALQARWELAVQREALGLRSHEEIDARYPIPGKR